MTSTVTDKVQARRLFIDLAKRRVRQGSAFQTPARSLAYTILAALHRGRTASLGEMVEALKKMSREEIAEARDFISEASQDDVSDVELLIALAEFEAKTHASRRS